MKRRIRLPAGLRRFKDWTRHLRRWPTTARLEWLNQRSSAPLCLPGGPVVSLTTHGARLAKVHLTLESIALGTLRPSRIILWLDNPAVAEQRPANIRRLEARGLEVKLTSNYGPHTKYYPYVSTQEITPTPLVTADDDMLYTRDWLAHLAQAHASAPHHIHCWRAKHVPLTSDGFLPYRQWPPCTSTQASLRHFAEGVSGVIYPAHFLKALRDAGPAFTAVCPKNDDVWLHAQAVRTGTHVQQIQSRARNFHCIPGTEIMGLMHSNVLADGNDGQIRATYTAEDRDRLLAAASPDSK